MSPRGPARSRAAAAHGRGRGCLASAAAAPVLLVLAPLAAAVRSWQAWRRGRDWRIAVEALDQGATVQLGVTADVPRASASGFPRRLTHALVRIAEAMRRSDDVYHLFYRIPGDDEGVLMPVGPRLQELGERIQLALGQPVLELRTTLWLALPADRPVARLVDPSRDDPEAEGEPENLVTRTAPRWAMAASRARSGPSVIYRLLLWVPDEHANSVAKILRSVRE
ncbi:MAG TPA: hypothetical protein VLB51_10730 [Methylomirabilota bacterium]|nr:hypothetical protein [Methylomirabilota bacterium]